MIEISFYFCAPALSNGTLDGILITRSSSHFEFSSEVCLAMLIYLEEFIRHKIGRTIMPFAFIYFNNSLRSFLNLQERI